MFVPGYAGGMMQSLSLDWKRVPHKAADQAILRKRKCGKDLPLAFGVVGKLMFRGRGISG
jgi:hypothetical protein